ncbi:phage portal protein [Pectobacterium brasiliense]|uniref:phage portal protein n=1 Tax=Pectobacterium brasiliense TaxID=180957 RepID=UPI000B96929A|nr:phage portal protein [Pectobacterium carotovorum]OYN52640.1 phage portal protein [Pectobacterium carotovorum]
MFIPQFYQRSSVPGKRNNWSIFPSGVRGGHSNAGVMVTPETAMAIGAVRACVTLLAESVAQLPCELYRRSKDGGRERATDHPLYDIIHTQPNKKDTVFEYYEQMQGVLGLEGNSFSLIDRDGSGYITELIPVNPKKIIVMKGPDALPYYHIPDLGETLPMRMVHHTKYFSLDGYIGTSPIQTNADVLGLGLAVEQHAAQVFARGTTMSGVIERPFEATAIKSQEAVDRILAKWTERYSGLRNSFSVGMLQEGMTYKQLSQDNEKAQLLQSRQWTVNEVCRLYKIPPHMIQLLDQSTNNNIEHQGLQFVMYTLLAWLKRHEGAMMRDLLLPSERREHYIEFNVSSLLRGDQKSRYESYALGRQWGWLSVNDIRRMENLPPIAGGNTYLTPLNMVDSSAVPGLQKASPQQVKEIEAILCRS